MSRVGANLLVLRKRTAMSQLQVAQALGVRQATISAWEQGGAEPRGDKLAAIVELFRVSAEELQHEDLSARKPTWADHMPPVDAADAVRRVRGLAARLEADLHEKGAGEIEFSRVRTALATSETVELLSRDSLELDVRLELFADYVRFVEAFRTALLGRVLLTSVPDARRPIPPVEPLTKVPERRPTATQKPASKGQ